MTLVIDIDDTILFAEKVECPECGKHTYKMFSRKTSEIKLINKAYRKGHIIIFHTGRGWDQYDITKEQLSKIKVKYHELIMGKPIGIYVDRDAITSLMEVDL
jgi:acid phosphatase class B